jgi:hypothetical protein
MKKLCLLVFLSSLLAAGQDARPSSTPVFTAAELKAFTSLGPIDTHTHIFVTNAEFIGMIRRLNLHTVDICLDDDTDPYLKDLPREITDAKRYIAASQGHSVLATSFDPFLYRDPGFDSSTNRQINRDFDQGAVAVKIWKNIGMEIKRPDGSYLMPDDPVFEPIYKDIAAHNKTLIAHLAEPDSCWKPLTPAAPDYGYYLHHPQWHMYEKPGAPSKATILQARDRILAENPQSRIVGAHLGSMESDFNQLAQHLDRYPNFAVDLAARMPYIIMLPREQAIAFFRKYQDRLIYGTDLEFMPGANAQETIENWQSEYARDWRFLATNDSVQYRGKSYPGLNLPQPVLYKLYHANAMHWFPGILKTTNQSAH